jgi:hypothetical protein
MTSHMLRLCLFLLLPTATLTGCAPAGEPFGPPDLVPVPKIFSFNPLSVNFCHLDADGNLIVTVRNQGGAEAPASVTRVDFGASGSFDLSVGALGATEVVNLTQSIPAGCFNADCGFTSTVDATNQVDETTPNEGNNTGTGTCIG